MVHQFDRVRPFGRSYETPLALQELVRNAARARRFRDGHWLALPLAMAALGVLLVPLLPTRLANDLGRADRQIQDWTAEAGYARDFRFNGPEREDVRRWARLDDAMTRLIVYSARGRDEGLSLQVWAEAFLGGEQGRMVAGLNEESRDKLASRCQAEFRTSRDARVFVDSWRQRPVIRIVVDLKSAVRRQDYLDTLNEIGRADRWPCLEWARGVR